MGVAQVCQLHFNMLFGRFYILNKNHNWTFLLHEFFFFPFFFARIFFLGIFTCMNFFLAFLQQEKQQNTKPAKVVLSRKSNEYPPLWRTINPFIPCLRVYTTFSKPKSFISREKIQRFMAPDRSKMKSLQDSLYGALRKPCQYENSALRIRNVQQHVKSPNHDRR